MKKKLKGLLSLWLAVVLVLGTPTVPVLAEGTNHSGHPGTGDDGWMVKTSFLNNEVLDGKYVLSQNTYLGSGGAVVNSNPSATICVSGNSLWGNGDDKITVSQNGTLTMDDCAENQGTCYAPFNVKSGGILNLKGGNYDGNITVETSGTLNIGDENGRTTKVRISCDDYISLEGEFELITPQTNYKEVEGEVKVFGWYASNSIDGKNIIDAGSVKSTEDVKNNYRDVWVASGSVYLSSEWVDGYTVTYKYNDNSVISDKTIGVVSGNTITLETPTRTGYTFNGWKKDTEESIISGGTSFKPTANTTLTAQWTQNPSPDPSPSPSPDPTPTTPPSNNSNDKDWNSVKNDVANAKDGDTVNIDLSKDTTVPGDILNSIKGKDVTLVLDLGNGMSWKINGNSITADKLGDINFSVNANSNAIPVEVVNKVSGERYTIQVSLAHNGPFGFEAILAVELDAKDAGLYANLFYYNPQTKELEFVGSDIITDKGMAEFTFTHASDYVIVIDKVSMDPNANIPAKGTKLTDKKTKAVYKVTKAGKTGGTVAYVKSTDKKATSISIPATVTIDGITYKVTSIAANAFKNNKTVKKVTIGKNVEKIGEKAFYGCKKLKSITIKTTKLISKNVGSDAFKGIANDAKIKVPEKKLDTYQKLLAKKGLGAQATVKK